MKGCKVSKHSQQAPIFRLCCWCQETLQQALRAALAAVAGTRCWPVLAAARLLLLVCGPGQWISFSPLVQVFCDLIWRFLRRRSLGSLRPSK